MKPPVLTDEQDKTKKYLLLFKSVKQLVTKIIPHENRTEKTQFSITNQTNF